MPGDVLVGIDLGTSGLRVVAVDTGGSVLAQVAMATTTDRPEPGAAEQSTADWWDALEQGIGALAGSVDPARWLAMGLSAMLPTLVMGDPSLPAVTWEDNRAEPEGREFVIAAGAESVYRTTGQRVDGRYLVPMAQRLIRLGLADPSVAVMGAKDFLYRRLTARWCTDPSTATGFGLFDIHVGRWDKELVRLAGLGPIPDVAASHHCEPLEQRWADRWGLPRIPVAVGAADSVLACEALGVTSPGDIGYIAGTSTVIMGVASSPAIDPAGRFLVTPMASEGYGLEMDLVATGSAFAWMADMLGLRHATEVLDLAASAAPKDSLTFLPYVGGGEQGALWNPDLRGVIAGLDLTTGRPDLARSLEVGLVVESKRCLDLLTDTLGHAGDIVATGSSAASDLLCQDLADACARRVRRQDADASASAVGAALVAARGVGLEVPAPIRTETVFIPRPEAGDGWAQRLSRADALRQGRNPG